MSVSIGRLKSSLQFYSLQGSKSKIFPYILFSSQKYKSIDVECVGIVILSHQQLKMPKRGGLETADAKR